MDDGHLWIAAALYIIFILIDFIFFAFGAAIQNINSNQLERDMESGDLKSGRILRIVNRPGRFVNCIQIVSNLMAYITGAALFLFFKVIRSEGWIFVAVSYPVSLIFMVSFGMVIPKRLAARKPKEWAYRLLPFVNAAMLVIYPVSVAVNAISYIVLKIFGIDINNQEDNVTEEDIMSMVNEGHEQGILESSEAEMITNIFELNDKEASDVMTHRKNLVMIDGSDSLRSVVDFMLKEGNNSRYPVYREDVDNITGILNMKDALITANTGVYSDTPVNDIPGLLRDAHFIPETRSLDTLFKEMQSRKIHMVIVVDEYGQTAGLVTMEDILEEIVGNIMDEYDVEEETVTANPDGSFNITGMTSLDEVADTLDIEFSEEDYDNFDTLNGFLIARLDRIPSDGEQFKVVSNGCEFECLKVENKMIHSVRAVKLSSEDEEETEDVQNISE